MLIRSWVPLECLTKMQNIFPHHSTSFKKLILNLISLILYEVFSLLIFLGAIKDKRWSSKFDKFIRHQRLVRHSIMRRTNWEMRRTLVSTPEITPTHDCGALLLGSVLLFYLLRKKKLKFQKKSIGSNVVLARKKKFKFQKKSIGSNVLLASSKEDIKSHLNFLIAKSVEMYQWHEASVVEMRENHRVMVFKKLLIAGDVELNPGPYPPELLARLINDFAELKPQYYLLGVQLKVPVYIIEEIKSDTGDRLAKIFDHWLHNTREDLWFEQLHTALQQMHRNDLADIVRQKYMNKSTQDIKDTVASPPSIKPTEDRDSQEDTSMDSQEVASIYSREGASIDIQEGASKGAVVQFYAMDETEMRRYPEVKADTNEIISHFSRICAGLYKWIRSNNDRIEELKDVIQRWLDIDTIKIQDSNVAKTDIDDMQSLHEVWRTFSNYHSFFNFGIVEQAIDITDYKEGKDNMKKYKTVFSNYLKRKVTQCPSRIGMKGNNHKVIIVKLDNAFSGCRMEHLQLLGKEICRVLGMKEKIQVEGVIKGSYCVTFHLYKSAVPHGFYLVESQLEILKDFRCLMAKILNIECGSMMYIVNEETDEPKYGYAGGHASHKGGILHPRAALHWTHCHKPLWRRGYFPRSCAVLQDKVAILTSRHHSSCDILHVSSTRLDLWTSVTLPYQFMSLTTYQSRFVVVGGRDHLSNEPTNELLTSTSGLEWESSLPPMPTKRYMTSSVSGRSPEALVVAGGRDSQHRQIKVIEVLVGDKWTSVDILPSPDCGMHSTFHDGRIFFVKDEREKVTAYSCSYSSLTIQGTTSSKETGLLWEQLQAPDEKKTVGGAIVSFSSYLVSINGEAIVRAYSNTAKSWVTTTSVGNKSKRHGYHIAASQYSTREIVFVHKRGGIYLLQLSSTQFSLESNFTPNILTRLEASGVGVATLLKEFHSTQDSSLDLQEVEKMLLHWSYGLLGDRPPCWRELLMVLKNVGLSKLSTKLLDWLQQGDKPRRDAGGHVSHKKVLTVNADDHIFRGRYINANDLVAHGGFGSICFCKDLASEKMFAIKQNCKSKDLYIDSIHKEACILSHLGKNDHVIQMYGAVLDEEETEFPPPRVNKMMIELAEHGNLTNLLLDEQGCPAPLETDQALYYFWQLLLGMKFLHENSVLHLDIKSLNLLIFNEGKTLKLCNFSNAIKIDDIATSGAHSHYVTPMFAAPEICRQELPWFSADIWSCMCVLVEMLTALSPWHSKIRADSNQTSMMFMVGSYTDNMMEMDLVPCAHSLDQEILDLMSLVFKADHRERSTTVELLKHRLIINAGEYEAMFDICEDFEEFGMEGAEVHSCEEVQSSMNLSQPDKCTGGNRHSSKRLSEDSGTGSDMGYAQKSLAAAGKTLDSSFGTHFPDRTIHQPLPGGEREGSARDSGPDIDSPEGRKKFLGMELDSPTHKVATSQTQNLDRQDSEEDDDVEKELPLITHSHPLSNSAPSTTDSHTVTTTVENRGTYYETIC